jgi:hypothetical protein
VKPEIFEKLPGVSSIIFAPIYERVLVSDTDIPFSWISGYGRKEIIIPSGYVDITITSDGGEVRKWTYPQEKAERFLEKIRMLQSSRKTA